MAPSEIPLAVTVAVAGLGPVAQIADLLRNSGTLRAAAARIADVLDLPPSVGAPDHAPRPGASAPLGRRDHADRTTTPSGATSDGDDSEAGLVLERVSFSYDGNHPVLDRFSLHVRPGEVVALTGPSGAGKTTAARLVLRLRDPDGGTICVDGTDVRTLPDDVLRRLVALVPQSSPLLRGTVRTNILLGAPDHATRRSGGPRTTPGCCGRTSGCRSGWRRPWASTGTGCPEDSARGSPSRERCCADRGCWSSTRRRRRSTTGPTAR
ncbi:ATP-binding cassette domain-containing protein [Isoptericola sp. 4D.3]|uniref:ATP-binding cassette domain-containing protein n=1 Tax=Isoptericola peretonis TaxID=2918523 RepID=A0ABT0J189_9MICO|nr:ATP-binding cassette domain-containing protein [Isoptericola sp. 4D.3]